jgi:5-methylcytosine-specific restriction protein A
MANWQGPRTQSSKVTSTYAWKKLRLTVLRRDRYQCQVRGPRCIGHAEQVDHVHNTGSGGAHLDPNNTQAICIECHHDKTNIERFNKPRRTNKRPPEPHPGLIH